MQRFFNPIAQVIHAQTGMDQTVILSLLEIPPDRSMGDIALPCFRLAKEWRKAPQQIAKEIADQIGDNPWLASAVANGPYVNFMMHRAAVYHEVQQAFSTSASILQSSRGQGQTVAVDLSSPNIAKPFSMGHLRSTVIGTALSNLLATDGYTVLRINHLGDWGTQFGKIIVAYRLWGDENTVKQNPIAELNALYVRFHEEANLHPELNDQARAVLKNLEDGDQEDLALWRFMVDVSLAEFERMYKILGTSFTHQLGESFYNDKMDAVVDELRDKGLLVESDGAQVVNLDAINLPPCLIRRSDGATLYATRDLAAALYRHTMLHADKLYYVVGNEQKMHFQQLFHVLKLMGYPFASACFHIGFGMMRLDGRKMSTRKGQIVRLEEVLAEATSRAKAITQEKNPSLDNLDAIAQAIGVGAVIFNDLKTNRLHDIDFSLDKAVAFDGETGPYVQYTHARACSVLRKANFLQEKSSPATLVVPLGTPALGMDTLIDDPTWQLVKELSMLGVIRERAIDEADPSLIAKHVLDICQAFNHFYHDCPILSADEPLRTLRLSLVDLSRLAIRACLDWLGVGYPAEI